MKCFLAVVGIVLVHGSFAALLIKGPTKPILEGQQFTVECLFSDSEFNISQVHLEIFSKYMKRWRPFYQRYWCRGYGAEIQQTTNSLLMSIPHASSIYDGSYRCVSHAKNVTAPDNSSQVLAIKVQYMGQLSVTRQGYSRYLGLSEELKVRSGDDVMLKCSTSASEPPIYTWHKNGSDWILPSSKLALMKVSSADQGEYTCMAMHPSVEVLRKSRTISITVLSVDAPWYGTSDGQLMLMTSVAVAVLLVFIASVSVFLCRRAKCAQTAKGPIDDNSQKKPIYRTSAESLLSTSADKQPLV